MDSCKLATLSLVALLTCAAGAAGDKQRPNFILFIADNISWSDLGCYGDRVVKTPHIDQLATDGVLFHNAYLTVSSCSPSRSSIITGRYPHNTGACELHTVLPDGQLMFPQRLKEAGYYTVLSGKNHMGEAVSAAFTRILRGTGPGGEADWVDLLRSRPKDRPFFFWCGARDVHRPWQLNEEAPVYDPDEIEVPPFLYDGPGTRKDLAGYYHEVSRTDHFVGKLRQELQRQKTEENTYVIYMSDNGREFPRCITRLYDSGIKTPLIITCPGRIRPGVCMSLVSAVDLAPTVLDLAGLEKDARIQGVSIEPLLKDPTLKVRDYVFAEHNWHVHQAHERMVRWCDWVYIRNARPERQALCVEASPAFPAGEELWEAEANGALKACQRDIFHVPRPPEELYDVSVDPDQIENVAGAPGQQEVLVKLRQLLDRWIEETGDTIPVSPTNDREDAYGRRNADFQRGAMPGSEKEATSINNPGPLLQRIDQGATPRTSSRERCARRPDAERPGVIQKPSEARQAKTRRQFSCFGTHTKTDSDCVRDVVRPQARAVPCQNGRLMTRC